MGQIRNHGGIWWMRYQNNGQWHAESSHSSERGEAERLLQRREVAALDAMCAIAGEQQRHRPDIRDRSVVPDQVQTAALLSVVCAFVRRYVVLSDHQATAVALWAAHTHAIDAADCTPYLHITAGTKRAGKTRLIEVLETLVRHPWRTDRVSSAVLVRKIDAEHPTLLLDETDATLGTRSEYGETLRGLLNSGYRRGGSSSLCVGHGTRMAYRDFSTFAAKALAGIGGLPDTVRDRAIPIMLQRRLASESVERWRERDGRADARPIAARLATWAHAAVPSLQTARPALPETLDDRAADVWEPLLAIADGAGADWAGRARQAAEALSGQVEDADPAVQLLQDIRDVLDHHDGDVIATSVLLDQLVDAEDRPWSEWRRGHALTARGLARLLEPLGVEPDRCDTPTGRLRGYRREAFCDAIARYLPPQASMCPKASASRARHLGRDDPERESADSKGRGHLDT